LKKHDKGTAKCCHYQVICSMPQTNVMIDVSFIPSPPSQCFIFSIQSNNKYLMWVWGRGDCVMSIIRGVEWWRREFARLFLWGYFLFSPTHPYSL